jgi:hypothetical protein
MNYGIANCGDGAGVHAGTRTIATSSQRYEDNVLDLHSLAFVTYRNLQAHTRHSGFISPSFGQAGILHQAARGP